MTDIFGILAKLRRPQLLIRTARIGSTEYRRDVHLPRLLGRGALPRSGAALMQLIELEAEIDAARRRDDAGYRITRHIDVLIAMMGEARILRASHPLT